MKKLIVSVMALVVLNIILVSAGLQAGAGWKIPDTYKTKKNPVKASAGSLDEGKDLWNKHCKVCHGATGAGDGVKAKNLGKSCGDLSSSNFQAQLTDGGIFYLSFVNEVKEHDFDKKLPDEVDRWNIVNYIRTFKE